MQHFRPLFLCLSLCGLLFLLGCGRRDGRNLPTAPVSGTVTYNGNSLTEGSVVFMHASGETVAGELGTDGRYAVQAPIGPNQVLVQSREPEEQRAAPEPGQGAPMGMPGRSRIPERYSRFESSGLTLDVEDGQNALDITLSDEGGG